MAFKKNLGIYYIAIPMFEGLLTNDFFISFFVFIAPCSAGQNSSDGLPPCENCPLGTYQPNTGRVICLPCPDGGKFGGQAGAVNASQCPGEFLYIVISCSHSTSTSVY